MPCAWELHTDKTQYCSGPRLVVYAIEGPSECQGAVVHRQVGFAMSHDSCTLPPPLVVMHPSMLVRNSSVLSRGSVAECGKRAPQPWLTHRTQQGTRSSALQHAALSRTGRTGVVIVDHGSRKRDSNEMLTHFGLLYQQVTGAEIVEVAHMEIAEPTIEQAVGRCAAAGADTVVVAPYFLSRGRHIQEDIPALVKEAQAKHPAVTCVVADPIGIDPLMAKIIEARVQAAVSRTPHPPAMAAAQ
ncbi:hypothetical protein V8C86DRAFT_2506010 [Haematococcus lacustris]